MPYNDYSIPFLSLSHPEQVSMLIQHNSTSQQLGTASDICDFVITLLHNDSIEHLSPPEQVCTLIPRNSTKQQLGTAYRSLYDQSDPRACVATCLRQPLCKAFHYHEANETCDLFQQSEQTYSDPCCDHYDKQCISLSMCTLLHDVIGRIALHEHCLFR